jgi:hypothetical protein
MYDDMNFLAFIIGLILIIFIICKYNCNKKILNNIMTDLPHITRYYL